MSNPSLDRKCFLPLSDINLPSAFTLHPNSANPCHDLVALYRPLSDTEATANEPHVPAFLQARMAQQAAKEKADSFLPSMVKGKQKEDNSKQKMRIGLWRAFSGVHVWDVDITGNAILGLAWSLDGLYLSLIIRVSYINSDDDLSLKLIHLSVQDGSLVHMLPLTVAPRTVVELDSLEMEWCESGSEWPKDAKGSAGMIIDSIPQPNPVEHFEFPERNNPMAVYNKKKVTVQNPYDPHSLLQTFPSLLESHPPNVLCIPALSLSFLAGTFTLTSKRSLAVYHSGFTSSLQDPLRREDLLLARSAARARRYCDTILKGLEACWSVWRKGIMEELNERLGDLERCASDAGVTRDAAMADLLRLLVTGRCGDAVTQLIGGKLTEGILTKWMAAYDNCVEYIHETLSYCVFPAVERLLLLLEELRGWSMHKSAYDLNLEEKHVEECIEWAKYLAIRVMDMDQDLADEAKNFREFGKWLKHEISRATSHDDDDPANAASKHNVASAAAYLDMLMDNASKVTSCFLRDTDRLASTWAIPQLPISRSRHRPLPVVLKELMTSLRGKSGDSSDLDFDVPDFGESSSTSAAEQSSIMEESIIDSENSRVHDKLPSRQPGADPLWAIADVMLSKLENLLSHAPREHTSESVTNSVHGADTGGMLHATRVTENKFTYKAVHRQGSQKVCIQISSPEVPVSRVLVQAFRLPERTSIVNLDFFDDNDLVIALRADPEDASPTLLYLAVVPLIVVDSRASETAPPRTDNIWEAAQSPTETATLPLLPISRSRRIGVAHTGGAKPITVSLALNGRKGRRFACVGLSHGPSSVPGSELGEEGARHVTVLDLDEDEETEEEGVDDDEEPNDGEGATGSSHSSAYMDVD